MATFQTYQAVGNREDLTDVIENISPVDTWFTSNTGSVSCEATYHEWQTDALADAAENKTVEGADFSDGGVTATTRAGNYTQILTKQFKISGTQDAVSKAGRKKEVAYQIAKKSKEMARDIEYALVINATAASGASGTERTLKGVLGWIATNVETGTGTGDEALTEDMYNDNLQTIWAAGGMAPFTTLVGAFNKRAMSAFTTNTKYAMADEKKLTSAVNIYESDFGVCAVRLHHQLNTSSAGTLITLGDMDLWKKAWLRRPKRKNLGEVGDSTRYMLIGELTLESRQEKGSGKITGLTTS